jgi:nitroimidazol reductase NimA-like FMN-containing flavoprotein (pyridoxamine 5'-phosphate oxidase superfamily)
MAQEEPTTELDPRFSDEAATPTPWSQAREQLEHAKAYWVSTVRPDGRPHVTTIAAVWLDGALHFTTGQSERKAQNLERNTHCVVTTGCNVLDGLDVVVEGEAVRVTDEARLRRVADAYVSKYDQLFVFHVRERALWIEHSVDPALTFELRATKAFGFGKGDSFSQTRWRFESV